MGELLTVSDLRVDIATETGVLHAVRGISLSVAAGETLCIVGESGCGKSLTSLALMGLLPKNAKRTAGSLMFDGEDLQAATQRRMEDLRGNRLSMIFQDPMTAFNPSYTIGDQLEEVHIRHRREGRAEARRRALYFMERVGITAPEERLGQYVHQLSGGLRQRVMIAMALMCEPRLLLADEPTTALDVTIQAQVLRLLCSLQRELGLGMILITHDLGVVAAVADRVAVMYAGQIVEEGTAQDIFRKPSHPYTRGLMACAPRAGALRGGRRLGTIPGFVPSNIGDLAGCGFADRCPEARSACRSGAVPEITLGPGRMSRCLFTEERALANA